MLLETRCASPEWIPLLRPGCLVCFFQFSLLVLLRVGNSLWPGTEFGPAHDLSRHANLSLEDKNGLFGRNVRDGSGGRRPIRRGRPDGRAQRLAVDAGEAVRNRALHLGGLNAVELVSRRRPHVEDIHDPLAQGVDLRDMDIEVQVGDPGCDCV